MPVHQGILHVFWQTLNKAGSEFFQLLFRDVKILHYCIHQCIYNNPHGLAASIIRKLQCPVFFRLLYSSGMRTTEARYLKRADVDLEHGVVNIRKSKGYDQHYIALHDTMTELLVRYDEAMDKIQPERTYFFESLKGKCYGRDWVNDQ